MTQQRRLLSARSSPSTKINPRGVLRDKVADEVHNRASTAEEQHAQDQQAEQQLKQQQHQQDERSAFQKGSPQGRR
jgi:hypothetical protein